MTIRRSATAGVTPGDAGWRYLSFRVVRLAPGETFAGGRDDEEVALVALGGRGRVEAEGERWELGERRSVFDGLPWTLYLPAGARYRVAALGGAPRELAVCAARASERHPPRLIAPDEVEIEVRGAGNATRQISHVIKPEFPAHRLLVVEVLTPAGNWSSVPPHKHDEDRPPAEVVLEEVYYYRFDAPEGFGIQRLYTLDGELDETETVRDGDLLLIPRGYHPFVAAHGYDAYYLNALAGDRRSMAASDDPAYAWMREAWAELERDARVPLVTAAGRRATRIRP